MFGAVDPDAHIRNGETERFGDLLVAQIFQQKRDDLPIRKGELPHGLEEACALCGPNASLTLTMTIASWCAWRMRSRARRTRKRSDG